MEGGEIKARWGAGRRDGERVGEREGMRYEGRKKMRKEGKQQREGEALVLKTGSATCAQWGPAVHTWHLGELGGRGGMCRAFTESGVRTARPAP